MARIIVREVLGPPPSVTRARLFRLCQRLVDISVYLPEDIMERESSVFLEALACGITVGGGEAQDFS
jgi:hypothetical protein